MKDPAFLFYSGDFISGTMLMSNEELGIYIRLLCIQHQSGHLSKEDLYSMGATEKVISKFAIDENGKYYNKRLDDEINKRIAYSNSRRKNREKKICKTYDEDMNNICKTYDEHMENENRNRNINDNRNNRDNRGMGEEEKEEQGDGIEPKKSKGFCKPTVEEIESYCIERNNNVDSQHFYDFYESKGWMVGKNKMKDWKACVRTWERSKNNTSQQITTAQDYFDYAEELRRNGL